MEEKLLKIINHYGVMPQLKQLNEEHWELQEAIRDYEEQYVICDCDSQYLKYEKQHITEEMADVFVMISQFKEYYHIDGKDIMEIVNQKIDRQLDRISKENK